MFIDEDGFFAHEFYEEQQVSCDQVARWVMKRIYTNLTPEVRRNILHATMHSCMQLNTVYSMITVYMHGHVQLGHGLKY